MFVLRDVPVQFDETEFFLALGGNLGKEPSPQMREGAARLLPEALELIEPKALFDVFPVQKSEGKRIYLDEDSYFQSGLLTKFVGKAERLVLCIYTVGNRLEDRVDEYMRDGRFFDGTLLDAMGTVLLSTAGLQVYEAIKALAEKEQVDPSVPVSPGQVDWLLKEQRIIFERLNASQIGVSLTRSSLMIPKKSVSIVVGLGRDVVKKGEGRSCDYCPLRETCPSRRISDYRLSKENDRPAG